MTSAAPGTTQGGCCSLPDVFVALWNFGERGCDAGRGSDGDAGLLDAAEAAEARALFGSALEGDLLGVLDARGCALRELGRGRRLAPPRL